MHDTETAATRKAIRLAVIEDDHGYFRVRRHTAYKTSINGSEFIDVLDRVKFVFRGRRLDHEPFRGLVESVRAKERAVRATKEDSWIQKRELARAQELAHFITDLETAAR